jgi:putative addiction module component (TIGR02574 family)
MPAMQSELTEQAKKLSIPDRIILVEEIWDTIAEENQAFELTDAQKRELDRGWTLSEPILDKAAHGKRSKLNS